MRNFSISANKIISVEAYKVVGYPILRRSKGLQVQIFIFSWVTYESPKIVCFASRQYKYQNKSLSCRSSIATKRPHWSRRGRYWFRWQLFYGLIFPFSFSLLRPSGPSIENSTVIDELHSITKSMQSSDQTDKRKD